MITIIEIVVKGISKMKCFSGNKKNAGSDMINRFDVITSRINKIEKDLEKMYEKGTVDEKMEAVKEDLRSMEENLNKMYEKGIVDEKMEGVKQTLRSMEETLEDRTEHLKEQMGLKLESVKDSTDMQLTLLKDTNGVQLETIKNDIAQLKMSQKDIHKNILNISNKL